MRAYTWMRWWRDQKSVPLSAAAPTEYFSRLTYRTYKCYTCMQSKRGMDGCAVCTTQSQHKNSNEQKFNSIGSCFCCHFLLTYSLVCGRKNKQKWRRRKTKKTRLHTRQLISISANQHRHHRPFIAGWCRCCYRIPKIYTISSSCPCHHMFVRIPYINILISRSLDSAHKIWVCERE